MPSEDVEHPPYSAALKAFVAEAPLERESIADFVAAAAVALPAGKRVIDIGAGDAPYREFFSHVEYVTLDHAATIHAEVDSLGLVGSADDLPVPGASFDAVICTQVLEHLANPQRALSEFERVLRPGGRLFLTAPLVWEEHEMPFDFFRYTSSGLRHLVTEAGFEDVEIEPRTDSFTAIAQLLLSARWSLPGSGPVEEERQPEFRRLEELAGEVLEMAHFDGRSALPLGFTVTASRAPAPEAVRAGTSRRTPIVYIAPWVDLGGSDKGTIDWFKHIDRERWAPSIITTQPSLNRWIPQLEPYAEEVWALPDLLSGAEMPRFILSFIESRGIEVLHIMNSQLAFDLMPDITCLEHPPVVVVQLHAEEQDRSGYVRYVATRYGSLVDAFSVTSRQLADAMDDYLVPGAKLHVIATGVDAEEEFDPRTTTPFTDLAGEGPRILWPGRLVDQKDPHLTLDVIAELAGRGVQFMLDVVGDGDLRQEVHARAQQLGIAGRITWHPPSKEMARWYKSADVLLMTSVFEGVPYVIYEALSMELPVVAPALAGNVELMGTDSSCGVLVEPRDDVTAYVDALQALLEDSDHRARVGRVARERMRTEFPLEAMGAAHDDLYEQLLANRPAYARRDGSSTPTDVVPPERVRLARDVPPERTAAVIVPCFQHGRFLREAIRSIHEQTLPAARIVVVDDASGDEETIAALAEVERDERVTVIRLPVNSGPSVARNQALARVRENYVLPLDADDMLLPTALEDMITQLEHAPEDVGFVYPLAQHFGSRHDRYEPPAYNLHLLLQDNYCAATSLFDRRVFDVGVRYPEDMLAGHEDWDVVLQLAARGVWGQIAEAPTFLYRKHGFSRVNTVEYGPGSFREQIQVRHPSLYADSARDRIKAEWAPALSVVVTGRDAALDRGALGEQSCEDFECIPTTAAPAAVVAALRGARGRFILLLDEASLPSFRRRTTVEHVIRMLWDDCTPPAVAVAHAPEGDEGPAFRLLEPTSDTQLAGVAWRRRPRSAADVVTLTGTVHAVVDLVQHFEERGGVSWRTI